MWTKWITKRHYIFRRDWASILHSEQSYCSFFVLFTCILLTRDFVTGSWFRLIIGFRGKWGVLNWYTNQCVNSIARDAEYFRPQREALHHTPPRSLLCCNFLLTFWWTAGLQKQLWNFHNVKEKKKGDRTTRGLFSKVVHPWLAQWKKYFETAKSRRYHDLSVYRSIEIVWPAECQKYSVVTE